MRKLLPLFIALFACVASGFGCDILPTDILDEQWESLPGTVNPAVSGISGMTRVRLSGCWRGSDDNRFGMSADLPFGSVVNKGGAGVFFRRQSVDELNLTEAGISGALHFKLTDSGRVSVGVLGGWTGESLPDTIYARQKHRNHGKIGAGIVLLLKNVETGLSFRTITGMTNRLNFDVSGNIGIGKTLFNIRPKFMAVTDFTNFRTSVTVEASWRRVITLGGGYSFKEGPLATTGIEYRWFYLRYSAMWLTGTSPRPRMTNALTIGFRFGGVSGSRRRGVVRSVRHMYPVLSSLGETQISAP